ncbi:hypothetical protein [Bradyrhizobium sp. Ash2021]|uniref:hypothetical protein n=1 Tax=Bradyrhizobium sp. Ash2021 TaxID=2954771 RepID=UPI00281621C7|nr:hypothetical protein [Bradyrhizobium sp. Ash2021]WMT73920.1 hypothetical protein NL528_39415 [Bradyrhizobium sp. Ash2021]
MERKPKAKKAKKASSGKQSGGVSVSGRIGSVGGDVIGRDKNTVNISKIDEAFGSLSKKIEASDAHVSPEANETLEALKKEVAKGSKSKDSVMATLLQKLVKLVPEATGSIVSAFATPLLGKIVGPLTGLILKKFEGAGDAPATKDAEEDDTTSV